MHLYNPDIIWLCLEIHFFCLHPLNHLICLLGLWSQSPGIEDERIDVDVSNPEINTDFEENVSQQEDKITEFYKRPGKEYL